MTKTSKMSTLKNLDLADDWTSHPAAEWLMSHKQIFLWGFIGLLVLLIAASRFAVMRTVNAEKDFFQAQAAFTQFQKEGASSDHSAALGELEQLDAIMKSHPEIQPKYEGPLAQTLLISGNIPQARQFADDIFKRTQPDYLQLYQDYTRTSLLIGEGRYEEALPQALQLKETLDKQEFSENPILYIYNLIRLGMIYQQTGQPKEELNAWDQLESQPGRLEAVLAANKTLRIGQTSLKEYIEQRRKALNE